jgi:3-methyladenine DNA glycosylase/8-oxoguanine DNA glycosylase
MEQAGGPAVVDGRTVLAFPEPAELAGLARHDLAALAGSERKADRLLAIARAFAEVAPADLRAMPTERLGQWLQALPGLGPWSTSFILLRGSGRADAPLPLGTARAFDRELLQAGQGVYGAGLTVEGLAEIAERYGCQRGTWGHYLRIAS